MHGYHAGAKLLGPVRTAICDKVLVAVSELLGGVRAKDALLAGALMVEASKQVYARRKGSRAAVKKLPVLEGVGKGAPEPALNREANGRRPLPAASDHPDLGSHRAKFEKFGDVAEEADAAIRGPAADLPRVMGAVDDIGRPA